LRFAAQHAHIEFCTTTRTHCVLHHNTQTLRFAPNDLCDVISLLAAVNVPPIQAETWDFSWCMLQNLCIQLIVLPAAANVLLLLKNEF
jgi:hypothetical protein